MKKRCRVEVDGCMVLNVENRSDKPNRDGIQEER